MELRCSLAEVLPFQMGRKMKKNILVCVCLFFWTEAFHLHVKMVSFKVRTETRIDEAVSDWLMIHTQVADV